MSRLHVRAAVTAADAALLFAILRLIWAPADAAPVAVAEIPTVAPWLPPPYAEGVRPTG